MSHSLNRRLFLGASIGTASLLVGSSRSSAAEPTPEESLARGIDWLLGQQAKDGGWHSETYGALRQGAAMTVLSMYALAHLHRSLIDKKIESALERGLAFLEPGIKKRGFVACPDGSLDYPTYGTAMLATAAGLVDFGVKAEQRHKFIDWVASGQLHESREFTIKSPHYGGWDLMGASQVKGLTSDTNVSCTCFAMEALVGSESKEAQKTLVRAGSWLARCQDRRGGGFWFSPDPHSINHKAGFEDDEQTRPKTYATATCDGLRCVYYHMSALDFGKGIAMQDALSYLEKHSEVKHVPGFDEPTDVNGWGMGLRFYYYQTLAKALPHSTDKELKWLQERRAAVEKQVVSLQEKDGRWQNESARMREDDPLIATSLAIVALASIGKSAIEKRP